MEFALILLFVIFFITIVLLLQSSRQKFLDFILFCFVGIAIDIICKDVFNISGFWYYMCDLAGLILLELAYCFYTMHTETTIISAKAKQIKIFGTSNVIKTKNNKLIVIDGGIDGTGASSDPYLPSALRSILCLEEGEYFIADLLGSEVYTDENKLLGKLEDIFNILKDFSVVEADVYDG